MGKGGWVGEAVCADNLASPGSSPYLGGLYWLSRAMAVSDVSDERGHIPGGRRAGFRFLTGGQKLGLNDGK